MGRWVAATIRPTDDWKALKEGKEGRKYMQKQDMSMNGKEHLLASLEPPTHGYQLSPNPL